MTADPKPHTEDTSRRGFLGALTLLIGGIPLVGAAFAALRAGLAPARVDRPSRIPLCRLSDVPEGEGILERAISYEVRRGPAVETVSRVVFVTRENGTPIAMLGECTHLTCPVVKREVTALETGGTAALRCPCHGGEFSRLGEVLDGPPPRPLPRLTLELPEDPSDFIHVVEI